MRFLRLLYVQVLIGVFAGIVLGLMRPDWAVEMKFIGDSFIALLKMLIGPIIFTTVVMGMGASGEIRKVGRIGVKAFLYFETVSNFALLLGLIAVNVFKPGKGFNVDPATLDPSAMAAYAEKAQDVTLIDFLVGIIPKTLLGAFTEGEILPILFVSLLFGYALNHAGSKGKPFLDWVSSISTILNHIVHFLMRFAPIGAFGSMAFTIGKYGLKSFGPLLALMGTFYFTCILFVVLVLGSIARWNGFSIFKFLRYIRDELFTVLGTSSSESVLVPLMEKLEKLGCSKTVVGLVVPTGYSFNLDGTNIYMTLAAVFVAQALGIDLSIGEQLSILVVAIFTSQGASGVTGAGFITLAATLTAVPSIPVAGLALILGIDRFMSEARALTNTIGNALAGVVISKWEKELDMETLARELSAEPPNRKVLRG